MSDEQFWHKLVPHGGKPAYETADQLWEAALEAFDWLHARPLKEEVLFHHKGEVVRTYARKMRPFTWAGVAACMGMSENGLRRYATVPEFVHVMALISDVIRTQKFEGAATNMMNASIIARDLGMADKHELSSPDGTMTPKVVRIVAATVEDEADGDPDHNG